MVRAGGAVDLEVTLAGAVSIRLGDRRVGPSTFGPGQLRLVTAMLVLERDDPVTVDALAAELWPEQPPDQWRVAVRGLVGRLRRHLLEVGLDRNPIRGERGQYVVDLPHVRVDVEHAVHQLTAARASLDGSDLELGRELAADARAVLSRPVLPGVDSPWADRLRDRLATAHVETLVLLGAARTRLGAVVEARSVLSEALHLDPLREDAWRMLMRADVTGGNTAEALRTFEACRSTLADELGVYPSEPTQRLYAEILKSIPDPGTVTASATAPIGLGQDLVTEREPYVGLRAFHQDDAELFFGRTGEVQELVTRLARHGIVAVVGPSGVGKSSLVRAGLLPALATGAIPESDTWVPIVMTPGSEPLKSLAVELAHTSAELLVEDVAELLATDQDGLHQVAGRLVADRGPAAHVLLVVDQLEEMFTLGDLGRAEALTRVLLAAVGRLDRRVVVVVTMRADFYDRTSEVIGLADLLSWSQYVVPVLTGEQVEAVVTGPARQVGVKLEAGLLGRILTGVAGEPGSLPLLQHLLLELWRQRTSDVMTRGAYNDLGGVAGALAQRAEAVYTGLGDDDRAVARRVLLRGVQPGEDTGDARRPVRASEWAGPDDDPDQVEGVVSRLVDARLLTATHDPAFGERTVELAHEALIDGWPRLRTWVDEARGWLLDHRRLTVAADEWERHGRHDDWLLAGLPLDEAHGLLVADDRGDVDLHLSSAERGLVVASLEARERAREEEAVRQAHERRLERRSVRRMRAFVALAVVVALVAAGLWVLEGREARIARAGELLAHADGVLDEDPELSLLLALEAHDNVGVASPEVGHDMATVLHAGIAAHRLEERLPIGGLVAASFSGEWILTAPSEPSDAVVAELRNVDTGDVAWTLPGGFAEDGVIGGAVTPDGSSVVLGARSGLARVWDTRTGQEISRFQGPNADINSASISPDGRLAVASWAAAGEGTVVVWDAASGDVVMALPAIDMTEGNVLWRRVEFSPDGTRLAVAYRDASLVRVWETETWDVAFELDIGRTTLAGGGTGLGDVAWSPEGAWLAVSAWTTTIHDARTGARERELAAPTMREGMLAWSPDGERLAVGRWVNQSQTHVWRIADDGILVDDPQFVMLQSRPTPVLTLGPDLAFTLDGDRLLEGGVGGDHVRVWNLAAGGNAEVAALPGETEWQGGLDWSPDGRLLAASSGDGRLTIWDGDTWQARRVIEGHSSLPADLPYDSAPAITNLDWSPDGTMVAAAGLDAVAVWDPRDGRELLRVGPGGAASVAFSPDSQLLAIVWIDDGLVRVVDLDGEDVARADVGLPIEDVRFSPDGRFVTGAVVDEGVVVWDWQRDEIVSTLESIPATSHWDKAGTRLLVAQQGEQIAAVWDMAGLGDPASMPEVVEPADGHLVTFEGHTAWIQEAVWSHDEAWVATCAGDGTARLWDAATGRQLQLLMAEGISGFCRLRFSPDGRRIAISDAESGLVVLSLDLEELAEVARSRITRDWATDECRAYLDVDACPT